MRQAKGQDLEMMHAMPCYAMYALPRRAMPCHVMPMPMLYLGE